MLIRFSFQILTPMASGDSSLPVPENDETPDFTIEDLTLLKQIFLSLEKAIDEIQIKTPGGGDTFQGGYIFGLLEKANVRIPYMYILSTNDEFKKKKRILFLVSSIDKSSKYCSDIEAFGNANSIFSYGRRSIKFGFPAWFRIAIYERIFYHRFCELRARVSRTY